MRDETVREMVDRICDEVIAEYEAGTLPVLADEERALVAEITGDFFAFQAAACTASPDCGCGRPPDHPMHRR